MKFSRIKVALLTAGAIMSITPGITAVSANSVFAQETVVSYDRVAAAEKKNGFVKEGGQWNYYVNGKTKTGHDIVYGTINGKSGWYYIAGGKADLKYTGVTNNKHGWWYVKNGKVDFGYNGFAKNSSGWWYIENGKVSFRKNGIIKGTIDGRYSSWTVKNSKVVGESTPNKTNTNKAFIGAEKAKQILVVFGNSNAISIMKTGRIYTRLNLNQEDTNMITTLMHIQER